MIAPQTLFAADDEIGVVFTFGPCKRRRRVETNPLSSKSDFARSQNDKKNRVAQSSREHGADARGKPRILIHQGWDCHAGNDARDYPADGHPVRNNEMFEIDECSDNEERNKNPVADRHLPREGLPDREEQKCGKKLDSEIAKSDFASAICAATPEHDPADQRQILMPGNRSFTRGAKRATGLVDRKIDRQTINTHVE